MRIGVKVFPDDLNYAKKIAAHCDFIEIMAIPGDDLKGFKDIDTEFTIHTIHHRWGFNPANTDRDDVNIIGARTASDAADLLGSDIIVVHPGTIEDQNSNIENAINFLRKLDSRFKVENVPDLGPFGRRVCCNIEDTARVLRESRKQMCLDFPHAAELAHFHGLDYRIFIKSLMSLNPAYFHMSDTRTDKGVDMHQHLGDGNMDLSFIRSILPKDARITLETPHDIKGHIKDISLLRGEWQ